MLGKREKSSTRRENERQEDVPVHAFGACTRSSDEVTKEVQLTDAEA